MFQKSSHIFPLILSLAISEFWSSLSESAPIVDFSTLQACSDLYTSRNHSPLPLLFIFVPSSIISVLWRSFAKLRLKAVNLVRRHAFAARLRLWRRLENRSHCFLYSWLQFSGRRVATMKAVPKLAFVNRFALGLLISTMKSQRCFLCYILVINFVFFLNVLDCWDYWGNEIDWFMSFFHCYMAFFTQLQLQYYAKLIKQKPKYKKKIFVYSIFVVFIFLVAEQVVSFMLSW